MKLDSVVACIPFSEPDSFEFAQWIEWFRRWQVLQTLKVQVARERTKLADLPDYILKDIGVSAGDAWLESQRGKGDLPVYRVKQALCLNPHFQDVKIATSSKYPVPRKSSD